MFFSLFTIPLQHVLNNTFCLKHTFWLGLDGGGWGRQQAFPLRQAGRQAGSLAALHAASQQQHFLKTLLCPSSFLPFFPKLLCLSCRSWRFGVLGFFSPSPAPASFCACFCFTLRCAHCLPLPYFLACYSLSLPFSFSVHCPATSCLPSLRLRCHAPNIFSRLSCCFLPCLLPCFFAYLLTTHSFCWFGWWVYAPPSPTFPYFYFG